MRLLKSNRRPHHSIAGSAILEFLITLPAMILLGMGGFNLSQYFIMEQRSQIIARQAASGVFRRCMPLPATSPNITVCLRKSINEYVQYNSALLGGGNDVPTNVTLSSYGFNRNTNSVMLLKYNCDAQIPGIPMPGANQIPPQGAPMACRSRFNVSNIAAKVTALDGDHPEVVVIEHFHDYEFPGFFGQLFGKKEIYAATIF